MKQNKPVRLLRMSDSIDSWLFNCCLSLINQSFLTWSLLRRWPESEWNVTVNGYGVSFWGDSLNTTELYVKKFIY